MNRKFLYTAWAVLFILCAAFGFVPERSGVLQALLTVLSLVFFLPPAMLLYKAAGKTGTAEVPGGADNVLFVGFAPSNDPEIAFAIRIANGYSSTFAAEVGNDVMEYYYQVTPEDELITGEASGISTGTGAGD